MLKVGLVGIGGISHKHVKAWNDFRETQLIAICDNRAECAQLYPELKFYQSYDEMLENEALDIVDLCVPTFLHREFSVKAMDRGINVICEKPLSLKADEVTEIYAAAKRSNVKFMVTQPLHFKPEYKLLKELIDTQKYGRVLTGTMLRLSPRPAFTSGNWAADDEKSGLVAYDMHIHDLDFLVYALGKPTHAEGFRYTTDTQDVHYSTYCFGNVFVHCESAWYAVRYPWEPSYRFQFEHAVIVGKDRDVTIYTDKGETIATRRELCNTDAVIEFPDDDGYTGELRYFKDCVFNDRPVEMVTEDEVHTVIETLNTLYPRK